MSAKSSIEWTATVNADGSITPGATWNPIRGCTKCSPGCKNCYASTFAERWRGVPSHPYEQGFDLKLVPHKLEEPLRWKKPRKIFVNSMSDLFQDGVPFDYVDKVFAVMALCPQHIFQVLTKRAARMLEYFDDLGYRQEIIGIEAEMISGKDRFLRSAEAQAITGCADDILPRWTLPLPNVWLGVSVENQKYADERIPDLLKTPAAKRFASYEPALGPVDFDAGGWLERWTGKNSKLPEPFRSSLASLSDIHGLDWIIAGSESGPGARPAKSEWFRQVRDVCQASDTAFFLKQFAINGRKQPLPELDGRQWMEFPK